MSDKPIMLNVGCGPDYRRDFINIDANDNLTQVDYVMDISVTRLTSQFAPGSVDYILANDVIEHQFHWEAVVILGDFFTLLKPGGQCNVRVPDCDAIINNVGIPIETRLTQLYGGQDSPQGGTKEMERGRQKWPQLFCHKYGWTRRRMRDALDARCAGSDRVHDTIL